MAQSSLDSIDPTEGPAAGGTAFTLSGTFNGDVGGVEFGGVGATDVVKENENTITGLTPAHSAGVVDVVVLVDVSLNLQNGFTYTVGEPTMATVRGVRRTLELAGTLQDTRFLRGNVRVSYDYYEASALAAASVIDVCRIMNGEVVMWWWLAHDALTGSPAATFDIGLYNDAETAIDADCFADALVVTGDALISGPNSALDTIRDAAIATCLAATPTPGLGVPTTADGFIGILVNSGPITGGLGFCAMIGSLGY